MTIRMNTALRNKRHDNIFRSGSGISFDAGTLELRDGTQPATGDAALVGTIGATVTLPTPSMTNSAAGVAAKAGTWQDAAADNTITPTYFTMRDSTSTYRLDGSVAVPVVGTGTVSAAAGTLTFSTSQAGVVQVGSLITVGAVQYPVLTFNGTTSATVSGAPTFGASAFSRTDPADMQLDGTLTGGQQFTIPTFSLTDPA